MILEMKSSRLIYVIAALLSLLVLLFLPSFQLFLINPDSSWITTASIPYNSYHSWRLDPFLRFIQPFLGGTQLSFIAAIWGALVLLFGTLLLTYELQDSKEYYSWWWPVHVSTGILTLILLFGNDPVILSSLSWCPLLTLALIRVAKIQSTLEGVKPLFLLPFVFMIIFVSTMFSGSANQLSLPLLFASFVVAKLFYQPEENKQFSNFSTFLLLVFTAQALLALYQAPTPHFPDYPLSGHLVPDDRIAGQLLSNLGPNDPLVVLNRVEIKKILYVPTIFIFIVQILSLFLKRDRASIISLLFAICILFDVCLSESLSIIAPLQALSRSLPKLNDFPSVPVFVAGMALISILQIGTHKKVILSLSTLCLCILCVVIHSTSATSSEIHNGAKKLNQLSVSAFATGREKLISPSLNLLRARLIQISPAQLSLHTSLSQLLTINPLTSVPFKIVKIEASNQPDSNLIVASLTDNNLKTRWSASQSSSAWISITFDSEISLRGIELNTGDFTTDFPRGLTISAPSSCNTPTDDQGATRLAQYKEWEGTYRSSQNGFLFYTGRHEVLATWQIPVTTKCLQISQTGRDLHYDWSVAEVRLYQ